MALMKADLHLHKALQLITNKFHSAGLWKPALLCISVQNLKAKQWQDLKLQGKAPLST